MCSSRAYLYCVTWVETQFLHFKVLQMLSEHLSIEGRTSPKIPSVNEEIFAVLLIFVSSL